MEQALNESTNYGISEIPEKSYIAVREESYMAALKIMEKIRQFAYRKCSSFIEPCIEKIWDEGNELYLYPLEENIPREIIDLMKIDFKLRGIPTGVIEKISYIKLNGGTYLQFRDRLMFSTPEKISFLINQLKLGSYSIGENIQLREVYENNFHNDVLYRIPLTKTTE